MSKSVYIKPPRPLDATASNKNTTIDGAKNSAGAKERIGSAPLGIVSSLKSNLNTSAKV